MPLLVVYVLTAYAALVVVLTRLRLGVVPGGSGGPGGAGRHSIARWPARVHTTTGVLALGTWLVLLVAGERIGESAASLVGIAALLLWWVTVLAGLALLARWLPSRGRHAAPGAEDRWTRGPWLSVLGHLGMVGCVLAFTYAYLVSAV